MAHTSIVNMRSFALVTALAAVGVSAGPTTTEKELPRRAEALPSVTASGNAFFAGDSRFYMRGIDYQPGGSSKNVDPLADTSICGRDIPKFKELGVNTVRVYSVDNSADHAECMQQLNDAGIYLVLDVNSPSYSIRRDKPAPSYNADYLQSVFATIDEFQQYSNTLAFFSGNEVINNDEGSTQTAPFVKATTRDMRQYIVQQGYRKIPVGYSAADVSDNRMQTAQYFNCGSEFERSDFFAFVSVPLLFLVAPANLTVFDRTTILGALLLATRRLDGTRRLRTLLATVFPSSCLSGAA